MRNNYGIKNTIEMMNSADYKERFKAEYYQNVIRYQKLNAMIEKCDKGELGFKLYLSKKHIQHPAYCDDRLYCGSGSSGGY